MPKDESSILTPDEIRVLCMALASTLQDMKEVRNNPKSWNKLTAQSQYEMAFIMRHASSAKRKLEKTFGLEVKLSEYSPDDDKDFLKPGEKIEE